MIVVLGRPTIALGPAGPVPAGSAFAIAAAVASTGRRVELVGTLRDDDGGDAVSIGLSRAGIGHAALLRVSLASASGETAPDDVPRLEAADVELGLRYLVDMRVLVVADQLDDDAAAAAAEAAAYAGAATVVIVAPGSAAPAAFGATTTVLEAPEAVDAAAGPFAAAVARFAVSLEADVEPGVALRQAVESAGWEPVA